MGSLSENLGELGIDWSGRDFLPHWVDVDECDLDQFFTTPENAALCCEAMESFLDREGVDAGNAVYVEPSAGAGAFLPFLPEGRTLAYDLDPMGPGIARADFLTLDTSGISRKGSPVIAIGNPPFGSRGWLALAFLNKCAELADYVGFILPMFFESEGKGTPKYRVRGLRLRESVMLPAITFSLPDNSSRRLLSVFQIWERGENVKPDFSEVDRRFTIKTVSDAKNRVCGQEFKADADMFIASSFFPSSNIAVTRDWDEVLYGSGIGVKANDPADRQKMIDLLERTDWTANSSPATNGCRHIGMYHLKTVLKNGFEF